MRRSLIGAALGLVVLVGAGVTFLRGGRGIAEPSRPVSAGASASPTVSATPRAGFVESPEYPRPLLFRSAIEVHAIRGGDVDAAVALAAKYDLIIVKALDEEILDRAKVAPYLREIKRRAPEKIVLNHYDLQSHHPTSTSPTVWPGHWLLLNGTSLTAGAGDAPGDTTLAVASGAAVRVGDDLQVTALDVTGKPDYSRVEQMHVLGVNGTRVTVERGARSVRIQAPAIRGEPRTCCRACACEVERRDHQLALQLLPRSSERSEWAAPDRGPGGVPGQLPATERATGRPRRLPV